MTDYFMDTDGGSDGNNGTTWALAKLTFEGLLAVMSAGDRGWIQGAAADDSVADRTLTSPGTITNPCIITGVVDGTTNEPPLLADIAVTLPVISTTGAAPDINFAGSATINNIHVSIGDRGGIGNGSTILFRNAKFSFSDRFVIGSSATLLYESCEIETLTTSAMFRVGINGAVCKITGGAYTFTAAAGFLETSSTGDFELYGVDISGLTAAVVPSVGAIFASSFTFSNCKTPASMTFFASAPPFDITFAKLIASSDTSSQAAGSSIQDYEYEDVHGTIDLELTAVRTGGADDGASGAFAYAMTPAANATLESSSAVLKSLWMPVWVVAGSQTLTVYIANDSASTDYNEDEVWCEFYTPDAGDTAQHDQNFDPANARLFASSTAVTDDTGSTWGTGANNHQKMSATVTPGFEGWAYARLHLAKRQATPDTLFLDPLPEVS